MGEIASAVLGTSITRCPLRGTVLIIEMTLLLPEAVTSARRLLTIDLREPVVETSVRR